MTTYHAYWLSSCGAILPVPTIHIQAVIRQPARFGLTARAVEQVFAAHGEPLGHEGRARQEIMLGLIVDRGWVRVRYTPRCDCWTVELNRSDERVAQRIRDFFIVLIGARGGRPRGPAPVHLHADVRLIQLRGGDSPVAETTTIRELIGDWVGQGRERTAPLSVRFEQSGPS